MKYFILFAFICLTGCFGSPDEFVDEQEEQSSVEEVDQQPISDANPPYRMGCGEFIVYTDALGLQYYLPVFCQEFYIDKGRPVDRSKQIDFVNDISQPHMLTSTPLSDFDS